MQSLNRRLRLSTNFLHHKRVIYTPKPIKHKNIKHHIKKEENNNIDFDLVKDNFRHFLHLNLEDEIFEKELQNFSKY